MLNWLSIKNLALVEEADMEFGEGFNVISGESGAGKSVLMGAITLLLGERADKSSIRGGAERCDISAEFSLDGRVSGRVAEILEQSGMPPLEDDPPRLVLRRVLTATSGRNFINGSPAPLQTLKELGDLLVDIHGANDHQSLVRPSEQLSLLDRFGRLEAKSGSCHVLWEELQGLRREVEDFNSTMPSAEEAGRLRDSVAEIERVSPVPGEDSELSSRHALASHSRQIVEASSKVAGALSDSEGSVSDMLSIARRLLQEIERVDPERGGAFISRCEEISSQVMELSSDVSAHASGIELDDASFAALEERMRQLQSLKRRYGPSVEDVVSSLETFKGRLQSFENAEFKRDAFAKREQELSEALKKSCRELSDARVKAARKLSSSIESEMRKLGFAKACFEMAFTQVEPGASGWDRMDFLFSGNPGVPPKPLREIASSGELSRLMLAIKTALAEADEVPLLIFDEIDVNIGGETASKVGASLGKLSKSHQILCISHLPQVASQASRHFAVEKSSSSSSTSTKVALLKGEARVAEIARMLGGGKAAAPHAKAMLKDAANP